MAAVIMETAAWAEAQFGSCALGDRRRNKRMVTFAMQVAARPDGSTPEQTESWADCKAAYRLFDGDDVSFAEIVAPHCR
ncbi:MAG: transposase [Candidatus Saccharimonas sp.]|nr:transposase [Planctomycetaceae bacterium]